MNVELRHLRYFVAVAEELHFGRAAERLHISQPPLSIQIRVLEDIVGAALFHRSQRRVSLTKAGEVLLAEARHILARVDGAIAASRSASRGEVGELSIGFVSTADYNVLPPLLREFRTRAPGVRLTLREATTDVLLAALVERTMDAGFVLQLDCPDLAMARHTGFQDLDDDQFLLLLPHTDEHGAMAMATRCRRSLHGPSAQETPPL